MEVELCVTGGESELQYTVWLFSGKQKSLLGFKLVLFTF